ncbi:hypothetical protein IF2G_08591 [Cordyceps javanica]|nr:hypothetical protein IF2G_08591 [Cordyceps javanica]
MPPVAQAHCNMIWRKASINSVNLSQLRDSARCGDWRMRFSPGDASGSRLADLPARTSLSSSLSCLCGGLCTTSYEASKNAKYAFALPPCTS